MTTEIMATGSDLGALKLLRRGKVRDVYDLGYKLLIVSTDRLSAFDHILPTAIPEKGKILNEISAFWFKNTESLVPNHLLSADLEEIIKNLPESVRLDPAEYAGRTMLVKKAHRIDVECVVRGYLAGSAWKEYQKTGMVCGHKLPEGLLEASKLPEPIFTPSTKADQGHDEPLSREALEKVAGIDVAKKLERLSLLLYTHAAALLKSRGLILADTKFEFGFWNDRLLVIDEMLTPDSSRLWDAAAYTPGQSPAGFDKQYVRDYLEKIAWDKNPPAPALPPEVVEQTVLRYREALRKITS